MGIVSKPRVTIYGLHIHFITPLSLGRLWTERDFSYCKDSCISKTIKILSTTLMILSEQTFQNKNADGYGETKFNSVYYPPENLTADES